METNLFFFFFLFTLSLENEMAVLLPGWVGIYLYLFYFRREV